MSHTTVDTTQFNAFCKQISVLSAVNYAAVVKNEVREVLNQTVKNTPALSKFKLDNRFGFAQFTSQRPSLYSPTSNSGRRYRYEKVKLSKNGFIRYNLIEYKYPAALWSAIQNSRIARYNKVLRAKGLAQKSWVKIGEALGIKVDRPDYVDRAVAVTGQQYADTAASQTINASKVQLLCSNGQPTVNLIGGNRFLTAAIAGRIKFFEHNAEKAVFADVEKIAKAYPGIKTNIIANKIAAIASSY